MFYWKQIRYDQFVLTGPNTHETFKDYESLYAYCKLHEIDAQQA